MVIMFTLVTTMMKLSKMVIEMMMVKMTMMMVMVMVMMRMMLVTITEGRHVAAAGPSLR